MEVDLAQKGFLKQNRKEIGYYVQARDMKADTNFEMLKVASVVSRNNRNLWHRRSQIVQNTRFGESFAKYGSAERNGKKYLLF